MNIRRKREGNEQLKRALSLAIQRGRMEVVEKYVDFVRSAILLDAERIEKWHSEATTTITAMTRSR